MTIPFGKYKGRSLEYVYDNDYKYFEWLKNTATREPLVSEIAKFLCDLQKRENKIIQDAIAKIQKYINDGEKVFGVNVHNVGWEYRVKDISLEEVVGEQFTLRILKNTYTLHKDNFENLRDLLYNYWIKTGKNMKDRGLY